MSTPADYWAQAQIDPSYQATKGGLAKSLISQILNYGDSSALDPAEAALYGVTPDQTSAASANPYSTIAQLKQQLSGDQYGITNSVNSRGLENSGAYTAAQQHENQQGAQRNYNALTALQTAIGGIDTQNTNALTTAYGNIATNAANTPAVPTPDVAAANTPAPSAPLTAAGYDPNPSATANLPPISTITPANAAGDPRTGTSLYVPIVKQKTPKISLGHV